MYNNMTKNSQFYEMYRLLPVNDFVVRHTIAKSICQYFITVAMAQHKEGQL